MRCDQCVALMINGVFCHETGCPNTNATYNKKEKRWIRKTSRRLFNGTLIQGNR